MQQHQTTESAQNECERNRQQPRQRKPPANQQEVHVAQQCNANEVVQVIAFEVEVVLLVVVVWFVAAVLLLVVSVLVLVAVAAAADLPAMPTRLTTTTGWFAGSQAVARAAPKRRSRSMRSTNARTRLHCSAPTSATIRL